MKHSFCQGIVLVFLLLTGLVTAGCEPAGSLHPFYSGEGAVEWTDIEGVWREADGDELWTFRAAGGVEYGLTISAVADGRERASAVVHVVRLNGNYFLDAAPRPPADSYCCFVPLHVVIKARMERGRLSLAMLDEEWLKARVKARGGLKHEVVNDGSEDRLILTGSTSELQGLVSEAAASANAFGDEGLFEKVGTMPPLKK